MRDFSFYKEFRVYSAKIWLVIGLRIEDSPNIIIKSKY